MTDNLLPVGKAQTEPTIETLLKALWEWIGKVESFDTKSNHSYDELISITWFISCFMGIKTISSR